MRQDEADAITDLAYDVAKRASGFAARGSSIFNGSILAEELLGIAIRIRELAPEKTPALPNGE